MVLLKTVQWTIEGYHLLGNLSLSLSLSIFEKFGLLFDRSSNCLQWMINIFCCLCWAGVLCLWLYATGFPDSHNCHCLCDNSGNILLAKC